MHTVILDPAGTMATVEGVTEVRPKLYLSARDAATVLKSLTVLGISHILQLDAVGSGVVHVSCPLSSAESFGMFGMMKYPLVICYIAIENGHL